MAEKEYIERESVLETLEDLYDHHLTMGNYSADSATQDCINAVIEAPAVDVVEVKHGEWINEGEYLYKCSLCGDKAFLRLGGKPCRYCPSCGAKMDLKE